MQFTKILQRKTIVEETSSRSAKRKYYDCCCCNDTGFISPSLVKKIIPDYSFECDAMPVCSRMGCSAAVERIGEPLFEKTDDRFNPQLCEQLHAYNLSLWQQWDEKTKINVDNLVSKLSDLVEGF